MPVEVSERSVEHAREVGADCTIALGGRSPPALSTTSGINAIAHAVEALYAQDRNSAISLMRRKAPRHSAVPHRG